MNFVADPRFIDIIFVLVAIEALGVLGLRVMRGIGPEPLGFMCNLFAGAFLLLALRNALAGASTFAIAGSLAFALAAHLGDLALRWKAANAGDAQSTIGKQTAIAQASAKAAPSAPGRGSRVRA
jgi:hypothetical protein